MLIKRKNIEINKVITPSNFALKKKIDRKWAYRLIYRDVIDYIKIGGVTFVYLNKKSKSYKKRR